MKGGNPLASPGIKPPRLEAESKGGVSLSGFRGLGPDPFYP
jgi:hypothetical protein